MAGKNFKYERLAESIKLEINNLINNEIDDLDFVTIVDVELTKDLGDVKIYFQCLDSKDEHKTLKTFEKKKGFIKKRLAQEIQMRRVPELIFKYDHSLDNYNRIDELLNEAQNGKQ